MREVLIHLGSPKTGTSFIQTFLNKNTKKLNHHDIDYPSPKKNELPKFAEVEWETEKNGFLFESSIALMSFALIPVSFATNSTSNLHSFRWSQTERSEYALIKNSIFAN